MTDHDLRADESVQNLAEMLASRVESLAAAADRTMDGIAEDRARAGTGGSSGETEDALIDSVIERVGGVADDCRELFALLGRFEALAAGIEPEPAEPRPAGSTRVSEGVRLLATQMSVAGSSTEEIARRLEEDFGVEDSHEVVAALFGSADDEQL